MSKPAKRSILGHGRGLVNAPGTQCRFIAFLLTVLIVFTIILTVFQKLAQIMQLPVFLPVALLTLIIFVAVAGTIYSHSFVGPMLRIRRAVQQLAQGNDSISLHMRQSDDPMLKELVEAIDHLREHTRNSHFLIHDAAQELLAAIERLRETFTRGADKAEIAEQLELVNAKEELLLKTMEPTGKDRSLLG